MTQRGEGQHCARPGTDRTGLAALPYLEASGWLRSRETKMPVDAEARPIPWYTYAAIEFLARRLSPDMHVFEFGSGNSTRWWADRVETVETVEHDADWAARVAGDVPTNVSLMHMPLEPDGEYCRSAVATGHKFHAIVIDGRDRVNCARNCIGSLRHDGVIIWDDSQRSRYRPGYRYLARRDFRRLEFVGLGPMASVNKETSIFYREDNCLGI